MPCSVFILVLIGTAVATAAVLEATLHDDGPSELREQLRVLSKQVTALLDRRREDLEMIEENLRRKLYETPELEDIKNALKTLR